MANAKTNFCFRKNVLNTTIMKKITAGILIMLVLLSILVQGQKGEEQKDKKPKNSIHGLPLSPIIVGLFYFPVSYERFFKTNISLEITAFRFFSWSEMGSTNHLVGGYLSLRFYPQKNRYKNVHLWWGPFLSYAGTFKDEKRLEEVRLYGTGIYGGARLHIGQKRRWFIDGGIGFSLNYYTNTQHYIGTKTIWYALPLPRVVFSIGRKF